MSDLPSPSVSRRTMTRPALLSTTKISPFGATCTMRGAVRPTASSLTTNPGGTFGHAEGGRGTALEGLSADSVAYGGGRSSGSILCLTPGASLVQSPMTEPTDGLLSHEHKA